MIDRPDLDDDDLDDDIAAIAKACERSMAGNNRALALHMAAMTYSATPDHPCYLSDSDRDGVLAYAERIRRFLEGEAAQVTGDVVTLKSVGK